MAALRSILNTTVALRLLEVHSHSLGALVLNVMALISVFSISPGCSSTHNLCMPMPFPSGEWGFSSFAEEPGHQCLLPLVRWLAGTGAAPAGDLGQVASWSMVALRWHCLRVGLQQSGKAVTGLVWLSSQVDNLLLVVMESAHLIIQRKAFQQSIEGLMTLRHEQTSSQPVIAKALQQLKVLTMPCLPLGEMLWRCHVA